MIIPRSRSIRRVRLIPGDSFALQGAYTSQLGATVTWTKDGQTIPGANSVIFVKTNATAADAGEYRMHVQSLCNVAQTNAAIITVGPRIVSQPVFPATPGVGAAPVSMTVTGDGAGAVCGTYIYGVDPTEHPNRVAPNDVTTPLPMSFTWRREGVPISNGAKYTITNSTVTSTLQINAPDYKFEGLVEGVIQRRPLTGGGEFLNACAVNRVRAGGEHGLDVVVAGGEELTGVSSGFEGGFEGHENAENSGGRQLGNSRNCVAVAQNVAESPGIGLSEAPEFQLAELYVCTTVALLVPDSVCFLSESGVRPALFLSGDGTIFMTSELKALFDYYEKEKGIDRGRMVEVLSLALLAASKKSIGPARELRIDIDPDKGTIRAFAKLIAVEEVKNPWEELPMKKALILKKDAQPGDEIDIEVTPKNMGRIAAQTAKQTMMQRVRMAEKENLYDEFKDRTGDVVNGTVRRFDKSDVIVDLGKFEGVMPK